MGKVEPIIKTAWHQGDPYNTYCDNKPAGCGAIAMSQIFSHFGYAYNENEKYDWSLIPNGHAAPQTKEEQDEVARLVKDCGEKANTSYHTDFSYAFPWDVKNALTQFKYFSKCEFIKYDTDTLSKKIKKSLDRGFPVIYLGISGELTKDYIQAGIVATAPIAGAAVGAIVSLLSPGIGVLVGTTAMKAAIAARKIIDIIIKSDAHYFIIDGYNENDEFHVNWGWGGLDGKFYKLDKLQPVSYNVETNTQKTHDYNGSLNWLYYNIMPPIYYLSKRRQSTGEREMHTIRCHCLPQKENRIELGMFDFPEEALEEAKKHYSLVDGCYFCCRKVHTM